MSKSDVISFVTPWGTARYPYLTKPDTDGKFSKGKFKVGLVLSDEDFAKMDAFLQDAQKKLRPGKRPTTLGSDHYPLREWKKKDSEEIIARGLSLSSKYRPAIFDSKKNRIPEEANIGGGSELRIASAVYAYDKGIALRLGDVQVRKIVEGEQHGTGDAFDEVDGDVYEQAGSAFDGADDASAL